MSINGNGTSHEVLFDPAEFETQPPNGAVADTNDPLLLRTCVSLKISVPSSASKNSFSRYQSADPTNPGFSGSTQTKRIGCWSPRLR